MDWCVLEVVKEGFQASVMTAATEKMRVASEGRLHFHPGDSATSHCRARSSDRV